MKIMNILMIGNGFDIAHGLQTEYPEFLKWVIHEYNFFNILKQQNVDITQNIEIHLEIPEKINEEVKMTRMEYDIQRELWKMINENVWFQLFFRNQKYIDDNWIDFESEISRVIRLIDKDMIRLNADENEIVREISDSYFSEYFLEDIDTKTEKINNEFYKWLIDKNLDKSKRREEYENENKYTIEPQKDEITYRKLIEKLECDLNRLIRALEIYLCEYIETQNVSQLEVIKKLQPDHVLSFNYTDTYEKYYGIGKKIEYDYIHGKAKIANNIDTNNMVLGIDEYLLGDRVNRDVEFIAFKKFYQRIHKETSCKYREWIDNIRDSITESEEKLRNKFSTQIPFKRFTTKHYLYIFGHSLDVTDKDVLRDLILNDNVYTTIFYYNKKVFGKHIANLVKIIGKNELIRRTGGNTKTIEFIEQYK